MRSHLLATAIIASLGLAATPYAHAAKAASSVKPAAPAITAAQLQELQAQIAALQAQVQELQSRTEEQQAQQDAQSEVNVTQAQAIEDTQKSAAKTDSLAKLVNDNKIGGRLFIDATNIDQKSNGKKTANSGSGFDVTRFYLTFDHKFNDNWSANLTTDAQYLSFGSGAGANQANSVEVFIKKAYVQYKNGGNYFRAGAADTPWIPFVEKYYGYRYIQNTVTDRLSYGTSADWGVHAGGDYDNGFNYAASVTNGRGYRNPARSKGVDFEARLGFAPTANTIIGIGGYSGKRGLETELVDPPQTAERFDVMAAYATSQLRLGAEWFQAKNWAVTNVVEDKAAGFSVWGNAALTDSGINLFARYDKVDTSKNVSPDNQNTYYHLGVEFPVFKGIKISPVYKMTKVETGTPTATTLKTREFGVFGDIQF